MPNPLPRRSSWLTNDGGEKSFIHRYMVYMKDQETPRVYDYMCALWTLSSLIGRWSYIARPRAPVYLNMYMILAAESGTTRKSTSIAISTKLIRRVMDFARVDARLIESRFTDSALAQYLSYDSATKGHTHVIISISELAAVLGRGGGAAGIPALLTDLYDCPKERSGGGSVSRGEYHFNNVFVSFAAASTPTWLSSAVTPAIIEGGFTSRCLLVVAHKPKALIAWPTEGTNMFGFDDLVSQASRILDHCPKEITINPPALDIFRTWYTSRHHYYDPYRSSFSSREDAHVLRIAGLLCIADESYEINSHHIRTAIEIVIWCREEGAELFMESAKNSTIPVVDSIASAIAKLRTALVDAASFGLHQSAMYVKMKSHLTSTQLRTILEIMHELKMVQQFSLRGDAGTGGRPVTIWRATKNITNNDFNTLLLERLTSVKASTVDVPVGVDLVKTDPEQIL